jgi:hypothetical protein
MSRTLDSAAGLTDALGVALASLASSVVPPPPASAAMIATTTTRPQNHQRFQTGSGGGGTLLDVMAQLLGGFVAEYGKR